MRISSYPIRAFVVFLMWLLSSTAEVPAEIPTEGMLLWLRADRPAKTDQCGGVSVWHNHAVDGLGARGPTAGREPSAMAGDG